MSVVFPSLSTDGYIKDRSLIIKKVMEMFVSSDENQSNFYPIESYKFIVSNNTHGYDVSNAIKLALIKLYSVYFDDVLVNVKDDYDNENSIYFYSIDVTAYYNKQRYEISRVVTEDIVMK